jgi:hypothetical protein
MENRKLARHVTVAGKTYGPGDDVPAEIAEQIRNPKAWIADADEVADPYEGKTGGTASGHKLAGTVTVAGKSYGPRDFVPDEVAAQIRNPKAWADGKVPTASKPEPEREREPVREPGVEAGTGAAEGAAPKKATAAPRRS